MNIKTLALGSLLGALLLTGCSDNGNNSTYTPPGDTPPTNTTTVIAPVAVNDAFTGRANAQIAGNVLSNDTLNAATITAHTAPGHGAVTLNADGTFTYTPTTGFLGTDSFTYTLGNSAGTSTATVTLTLAGTAFFVNNQAAAGGDGSQAHPYQTLSTAVTAATGITGAQIVVFQGDGTSTGYNTPVTLASGQSLVGFSAAAQPVLTGPVVFTTGNDLENLKIFGPTGVAVNATGASNGTIQGVTVANDTAAVPAIAIDNATGTLSISNSRFSNLAHDAIFGITSTGSLVWSVQNCTFSNITNNFTCVGYQLTGSSSNNLTVSGCTMTGGPCFPIYSLSNTTSTSVSLNAFNNTINGGGTSQLGIDVLTQGTTAFTAILTANNITGCQFSGIQVGIEGNSTGKLDFKQNTTLGNQAGFGFALASANQANLGAKFNNNTSDFFSLTQNNTSVFQVEQLTSFSSNNTGTLGTAGTITNAAAGSLGIP